MLNYLLNFKADGLLNDEINSLLLFGFISSKWVGGSMGEIFAYLEPEYCFSIL